MLLRVGNVKGAVWGGRVRGRVRRTCAGWLTDVKVVVKVVVDGREGGGEGGE